MNAGYVRLQSRINGKYIHASEDGRSVHLDAAPPGSRTAVWAVERCRNDGKDYVRLRGVYGRYLGSAGICSSLFPFPWVTAVQRDFDKPVLKEIMWEVTEVDSPRVAFFQLRSATGSFLRTGVHISGCHTAKEWNVYGVETTSEIPPAPSCVNTWRRSIKREINWVIAEESGAIKKDDWGKILFVGRDMTKLEDELKTVTLDFPMSLFIRAGQYGTLTPISVNLPRSQEPLSVVALWGKTATDHQLFPNIDMNTAADSEAGDVEMGNIPWHHQERRPLMNKSWSKLS